MDRSSETEERSAGEVQAEFLRRIEDPDRRKSAIELFAADATVTRPGERYDGFEGVEEYLSSGSDRYEWVKKDSERRFETDEYAVDAGTLYGVTVDGERFEGVRYVDICHVETGSISRLDIYNDVSVKGLLD